MFLDYVKITLQAGQGGSGCMSFRREKFMPKGGPDGGDGGRGGSIILEVNPQLHTLVDYRYKKIYKAERGVHGKGSDKHGKAGKDIVLQVPSGTVVKNANTEEVIIDLTEEGQRYTIVRGGFGGRGNARFATSTHRSPREWEVGKQGEQVDVIFELKLIADVGLVGKPNAGKSTLLANITSAKPKIADYPFTTLKPNLGFVKYREIKSFIMADIPGLIEGASAGKGLGLQFLRHIERTRLLLYMIDPLDPEIEDPIETFETLRNELATHSETLAGKPAFVVLTKKDSWDDTDWLVELGPKLPYPAMAISSIARMNLDELKDRIWKHLQDIQAKEEYTDTDLT
ncbi:MAG: GTPase ObgE [Calditrichia bacterium]